MKKWSDYQSAQFEYKGVEFTCKFSILTGDEDEFIRMSVFDVKTTEHGVKIAAEDAAKAVYERSK